MRTYTDDKKVIEKYVDDNGVEYTMDDFRPDEYEQLEPGQCVCGAFDCESEYACHTSGY